MSYAIGIAVVCALLIFWRGMRRADARRHPCAVCCDRGISTAADAMRRGVWMCHGCIEDAEDWGKNGVRS